MFQTFICQNQVNERHKKDIFQILFTLKCTPLLLFLRGENDTRDFNNNTNNAEIYI